MTALYNNYSYFITKVPNMTKRNLFLTKTAIGIYMTFLSSLVAISPNIESLITRGKSESDKANVRDTIAIVVGLIGATTALVGRYSAGGVYTPDGMPGDDRIPKPPPG
jgi:hypothetical protein